MCTTDDEVCRLRNMLCKIKYIVFKIKIKIVNKDKIVIQRRSWMVLKG